MKKGTLKQAKQVKVLSGIKNNKKTRLRGKKGLKRTIKKISPVPISKLQGKIWEECKRIIRAKYGNICYTCGKGNLESGNWQTGHLLAKASVGAYLKYDLRILRPQCYFCNINCGGRGADFLEKMKRIEGEDYVNQIFIDKQKSVNAYEHYQKLLEEYKQINP